MNMDDMLTPSALISLRVNGSLEELEVLPGASLLDVLRDEIRLTGPHMGCMTGHCGACTVLIDGKTAKSCIVPAASLPRAQITTIEGLSGDDGTLSAVQQAFWDEAGFQCGYCAPGILMSTTELLAENPNPSDEDIDRALAGSLCRCTGYRSIVRSIKTVVRRSTEPGDSNTTEANS